MGCGIKGIVGQKSVEIGAQCRDVFGIMIHEHDGFFDFFIMHEIAVFVQ